MSINLRIGKEEESKDVNEVSLEIQNRINLLTSVKRQLYMIKGKNGFEKRQSKIMTKIESQY